jgi:hypothetical protein
MTISRHRTERRHVSFAENVMKMMREQQHRTLPIRLRRSLTAAVMCFGLAAVAAPGSASADAYGWQYWGGFTVELGGVPLGIPGGSLNHSIRGNSVNIEQQNASFFSAGNICNWRIDFVYTLVGGHTYTINTGPLMSECTHGSGRTIFPRAAMFPGKACAELYSNGAFVARQCHSIVH